MKRRVTFPAAVILIVLACASGMLSQQQSAASPAQQEQLDALKKLRDSGVLTANEYQAKVQAVMASTATPTPNSGAVRTADISDPALGMVAGTLQFPADWRFAGVVARAGSCASAGGIRYSVQTPDGNTAFEKFPDYAWSWHTNPYMASGMKQRGCTVAPILTAADFLKQIMIPNLRPDAQVLSIGPLVPEVQAQLDAELKQMRESTIRIGASYGHSPEQSERIAGSIVDGARARVAYTRNGQPVEEMLRAIIVCGTHEQGPGFNTPPSRSALCRTQFMGLTRAPKGQLEGMAPVFGEVVFSINPAWDQRVARIQAQQSQRMIDESWREHNQLMQQSQAAADARTQQCKANEAARQASVDNSIANARAQQNALDQSAVETEKYALGVKTVVNPNTGQTTNVSNQYSHTVQRQSDGTIFQYNDPAFDPRQWADPTQIFTEMPTVK
jgi:hypothetical protein